MPYYHVYVAFTTKDGTLRKGFLYNFSKEKVTRSVASPYMANRPIMVFGEWVQPKPNIDTIDVFKSEKCFHELILPNGKSPVDVENSAYTHRCFCDHKVKGYVEVCTRDFIISPPREKAEVMLMESASFLGLNTNWSLATCALQLQEVAVTLVAKRKNIKLDKASVESLLNKKIQSLSFNDRYEAFSRQVKTSFNIEMPILTTHLRRMRAKVLHEGYNPKPEETESIVDFTIGLLKKLKNISQAN